VRSARPRAMAAISSFEWNGVKGRMSDSCCELPAGAKKPAGVGRLVVWISG
jgi:hypothetical protein